MSEPNYYAVIPANVRYSKVTANAKLLYGEISALTNKEGFCWASNQYFADLYGVHHKTVSDWISELVQAKFVRITVRDQNQRKLYLVNPPSNHGGGTVKSRWGVPSNHGHNNTSNTTINIGEQSSQKYEVVPDVEEKQPKKPKSTCYQVFEVFKEVTGKYPLNWNTNKTQRQSAENLYQEQGLEQIRKALEFHRETKGEPFSPVIHTPYDLDSKWSKLFEFKKKHYGD